LPNIAAISTKVSDKDKGTIMSHDQFSSSTRSTAIGVPHNADHIDSGNQGEGNVSAARRINESTSAFAHSDKVQQAIEQAAPRSQQEAQEMERAEAMGQSRAKEEDPEITQDKQAQIGRDSLQQG
jgi:hypothetical protein